METSVIDRWIEAYVQAWNTNHPEEIGRLFTEDATYCTGPFDAPWKGRTTIVREWLARQDAPGAATFRHEVLVAADGTGVVRGWTKYHEPAREYSNVWLVRVDDQGRCREFIEWFMQKT
jgi:uncharacterized protein (TIGR02246 family)